MIDKLEVIYGILQNDYISGIPVNIDIVKAIGKKNVRSLIKMKECIGITIHNTANKNPSADDTMHSKWMKKVEVEDKKYLSAHFFVDQDSITQIIPIDEVAYHAGDGHGDGNYKTIAIEICENGDDLKAEKNAAILCGALIKSYPNLKLYKHQDWSGKYCPRVILKNNRWDKFKSDVLELQNKSTNIEAYKLEGLDFLNDKKLINDFEYWKDHVDKPISIWTLGLILKRFTIKNKL